MLMIKDQCFTAVLMIHPVVRRIASGAHVHDNFRLNSSEKKKRFLKTLQFKIIATTNLVVFKASRSMIALSPDTEQELVGADMVIPQVCCNFGAAKTKANMKYFHHGATQTGGNIYVLSIMKNIYMQIITISK